MRPKVKSSKYIGLRTLMPLASMIIAMPERFDTGRISIYRRPEDE